MRVRSCEEKRSAGRREAGRLQAESATGAREARTSSAQAAEYRCSDDRPLQLSQQPARGCTAPRAHRALAAVALGQVERARDEALQPVLPNVARLLLIELLVKLLLIIKLGRRGAVAGRRDLLRLVWRKAGRRHRGKAQQNAARGLREEHERHQGGARTPPRWCHSAHSSRGLAWGWGK